MAFRATHHLLFACTLVGIAMPICRTAGAQDDIEQPYLPGLVATYEDAGGRRLQRIDDAIAFDWNSRLPDARLLKSPFVAQWQGQLLAQGSGEYRLHVFASGEVEIRLAGQVAIRRQKLKEAWAASEPLTLSFDHHTLETEFRQTEPAARVALFWSGPQFSLEPITPRSLWHDRQKSVSSEFDRGKLLAAALRCTACHTGPAEVPLMDAPSLVNLSGNLRRQWLVDWLQEAGGHDTDARSLRRMPAFGLPRDQAEAVAAYLLPAAADAPAQTPLPRPQPSRKKSGKQEKEKEPPSAKQGERLFLTLGCLACHQFGDLGESGLFGGGDLTHVANKRPPEFFDRWLSDPAAINRHHRMPVFELSADERQSLSLFLAAQTAKGEESWHRAKDAVDASLADRGRKLVEQRRCGACHELPKGEMPPATAKADLRSADWTRSCAAPLRDSKTGLGYSLLLDQRRELQAYFRGGTKPGGSLPPLAKADGAMLLGTHNCLACHAREGFSAVRAALPAQLSEKLAAVGDAHAELSSLIPAMTPPSLASVGDKLHEEALAAAIRRSGPAYRPYLLVRMPRFRLSDEELSALVRHFVETDRVPAGATAAGPDDSSRQSELTVAGSRLVSTDGFGCVSCHQIGSVVPDKAPLNARGPSLSQLDQRIRREWFHRFIHNPARIVPRMEMPSVQLAVKGVLGGKIDDQVAAVWRVLNTPGFEPPEPNPVRVLRRSGIAERKERPIVINDVTKIGERTFIHPLIIGLPDRQNFLYDLSEGRLAAWWTGDAARQRTKGKSWHWEPGGPMVMPPSPSTPELIVLRDGKKLVPLRQSQHVAALERYEVRPDGVSIKYRVAFGKPAAGAKSTVNAVVMDDWWLGSADPVQPQPGVVRELTIMPQLQEGDRIVVQLLAPDMRNKARLAADGKGIQLTTSPGGEIRLHPTNADDFSIQADGTIDCGPPTREGQGVVLRLNYRSRLEPDTLESSDPLIAAEIEPVEVAPGFSARRLPLPSDLMPTALGWREAKSPSRADELVIGSLKGQVIAAADSDGDGAEDATTIVADGLATPYGIQNGGDWLHVLTKSALLAVKGDAVEILASGWGHTDDYHDWAVGLPRNEHGEYYVGLPCQQDERSVAAARNRGAVLKLTPREATRDNPSRFSISVISTGHRFPMGMALDRDGELFVTDNQGNYNPFNELNHVRQGAFFGFINANEKRDESFKAPPLTEPAIDIPHPWTRSVNGICFLDTPPALVKQGKANVFGPLEGHLIGCEYDTRRLIRMTVQKVGDSYQGAAYPLSLEPSSPERGFLGPVVCAVSPRGELYVGSIRDSGWGAGNNIGEVVQVRVVPEELGNGIAEVRAVRKGFEIDFFGEVDAAKAADAASYSISSYRRESTPAYGGPDLDRRRETISDVRVSAGRRRATLTLAELREGFVYEIAIKNLTADGSLFHPAEAHYTLRRRVD